MLDMDSRREEFSIALEMLCSLPVGPTPEDALRYDGNVGGAAALRTELMVDLGMDESGYRARLAIVRRALEKELAHDDLDSAAKARVETSTAYKEMKARHGGSLREDVARKLRNKSELKSREIF